MNLQGDVVKLVDSTGAVCAEYSYDAWGKCLSQTTATSCAVSDLADRNPIRYRGYYYDAETGWYYLQSRYYDPIVKRFINADEYAVTAPEYTECNMFAYCGNNPVMRCDEDGSSWFSSLVKAVATVVVATAVAVTVVASAGTVACVAGCIAASAGASYATAAAVATTASVACHAVAGSVLACGVNDAVTTVSGKNCIQDYVFGGDGEQYQTFRNVTTIASVGIMQLAAQADAAGFSCFVAGTLILTDHGKIPIEDVTAGEYVWAWDEESGSIARKRVVETYVNETDELVHVFVDGEEIITTPTHPFYCPVKGWTDAARLRAGDMLVLVNGEYVVVEKVQHELLKNPIRVYNFQVEDYHTYYVASGVLVHNSCNHNSAWNSERRRYWRRMSKLVEEDYDYGAFKATEKNIGRMARGAAPIGWDGRSVELHHWEGIANNFYNYSPLSRTLHQYIHKFMK